MSLPIFRLVFIKRYDWSIMNQWNHEFWKPGFIFLVTYNKKGKSEYDWGNTHWHPYRIYVPLNIAYSFIIFPITYRGWISSNGSIMWLLDLHWAEEWSRNSNVTLNYKLIIPPLNRIWNDDLKVIVE